MKIRDPYTNVVCYKPEHTMIFLKKYHEALYSQPKAAEPLAIKSFWEC